MNMLVFSNGAFDASGNYEIKVTLNDGNDIVVEVVSLKINNTNRLPLIGDIKKIFRYK